MEKYLSSKKLKIQGTPSAAASWNLRLMILTSLNKPFVLFNSCINSLISGKDGLQSNTKKSREKNTGCQKIMSKKNQHILSAHMIKLTHISIICMTDRKRIFFIRIVYIYFLEREFHPWNAERSCQQIYLKLPKNRWDSS